MRFIALGEALVDLVQSRADGSFAAHAGGSPFNVAVTLSRLGRNVLLAGQCGDDPFGELLTARLRQSGVQLDLWRHLAVPTSLAVAALDERLQADYHFYFDGTAGLACAELGDLPAADVLHSGSIASWLEPGASAVLAAMRRARSTGQTLISYDPNVRADLIDDTAAVRSAVERCVVCAHVVKASDEDVSLLYSDRSLPQVAAAWCELGASLVVMTRGADGAIAFGPDGEIASCAAPRITVADTVGAGDALTGGLLSALADVGLADPAALATAVRHTQPGDSRLNFAIRTAVMVAAMTCERPGANPPTAPELVARNAGA